MTATTLTSKGQVTIPKEIRDALGLAPGDRILFRVKENGEVVVEVADVDLLALAGSLRPRRKGVTIDEMKETVRRAATERRR
jgi:antitoxin PrlF